ncbi:MAG: disulfide bond formation protein B [Gemmataceae bacterium]|nr:disulfide bond formation protein B [Gemmataceae bacterium]
MSTAESHANRYPWTWLAFLLSVAVLAGSLYLTFGMGWKACPFCYYQRTFVMGIVAVLGMGLLTGAQRSTPLTLLALPLATAGLGVAAYHVLLERAGRMECPAGIFDIGTAPQQALAALSALFVVLAIAAVRDRPRDRAGFLPGIAGLVLGGLLAYAAIQSTSPIPSPTPEEYQKPPDICRPIRKA